MSEEGEGDGALDGTPNPQTCALGAFIYWFPEGPVLAGWDFLITIVLLVP